MPFDPSHTAAEIVDEMVWFDPSLVSDRDAMLRIAEAMLAGRSHIEVVDPAFRLALRDRLLANASAHTGAFTSQQIRRRHGWLRSFLVGSGFGTVLGGTLAYTFIAFVLPIAPVVDTPILDETEELYRMAADDVPMGGFSSVSGDTEPTVLSSKTNDSDSSESATKEMVSTQERASKDTTAAVSTSPVSSNESADRSVVADTPVDPTHGADSAMMVSDVTSSPEDLSRTVSNDAFSLSDLFAPPHDTVPSMDREYVVLVPSDIVDVYGLLPGTAKSYRSTGAVVPVPRALLGDFPVSSDLSLRFMTVADNEPYGLIYSIDVTNGSVFASKNEPLWNSNDSVVNGSGWQSEDEIVSQTDSFLQKFATLPVSFGSGVSLFEASSESVTIQYGMLIGGVEVYESYGVPRAATVSYDRAAKHVSGFSLPRIGGFSETEEVFVRPDVSLIESFIGNALFERGYDASQAYRISSLRMAYIASSDAEHPEIETFVPGIACSVVSEDGSLRETVTMPFGK